MAQAESIILFDGVCNFCSHSTNFIIQHDPQHRFKFAPLQSAAGQALLQQYHLPTGELNSVILIEHGRVYDRSTAVLRIARRLNKLWPLAYWLMMVPPFLRDTVYNWVARHRYHLFGQRDACMMPTPDVQARFLT
ncbi:MAG: thiol-disulfide oxidoreductase DCC family protein [Abitibacteriaceae bacterium]|nr:thiol-disulfide oxidoreductase DCC family protein [Abditibacteriaceae bacterium]MBV9867120.1 thiol-disulfide oxidoreductase DCC family protein [Abditibacteriaceae bacterium]